VRITLATVLDRLFKLSFDPYHCPELRWGDTGASTCPDNSDKRSWYDREQRLRNAIDPDLRARTTLDWGPATTPDIRIGKLLETLGQTFP
jgi:hypothetical protein